MKREGSEKQADERQVFAGVKTDFLFCATLSPLSGKAETPCSNLEISPGLLDLVSVGGVK